MKYLSNDGGDEAIELGDYQRLLPSINIEAGMNATHGTPDPRMINTIYKCTLTNHPYTGWRAGVRYFSGIALSVLIINLSLLVCAVVKYGSEDGIGILYRGNCQKASWLSTVLHIAINLLSTILLNASNYTMQCLNSPTREAVDRAHAEKKWLDIGIPSWRNRGSVPNMNKTLWFFLAFSSIPLHFFYNSAVFLDISAQRYSTTMASQASFSNLPKNDSSANYIRLEYKQCEMIYDRKYVTGNGDVYLMIPDLFYKVDFDENGSVASNKTIDMKNYWVDTRGNSTGYSVGKKVSWKSTYVLIDPITDLYYYGPINSCYTETRIEQCKVKFSVLLMIVVIACNLIKAICMGFAARYVEKSPLVTLGDAIASFLRTPDPTTKGLCLVSKKDIQNHIWNGPLRPRQWNPRQEKKFWAASRKRWVIVNILFGLAGSITIVLPLVIAAGKGTSAFITFGTSSGKATATATIGDVSMSETNSLFTNIILANLPQTIISFLNVLYNGLFTCMLLADEWHIYGHKKQPLRVTCPSGQQNSTYFLSVPYRYAMLIFPLTILLHWLISESLFLVTITGVGHDDSDLTTSSLAYSWGAILLSGIVCFVMTAFIDIKADQTYRTVNPVVGSCSAAISAACHASREEGDISELPIQWGVVRGAGESIGSWKNKDKDFGHCAFSGAVVAPPLPGRWYAGEREGKN
ncbi:hypothetical protein ACHAO1_011195 [Botrytis cinerea]